MPRSYEMETRKWFAAATRERIINAAHSLLERPDGGTLALQEVAAEAGVSRATIYNSIGSRRDLLMAVFVDQGRLIEFDRVLKAMENPDTAKAIIMTVKESCRSWTIMPDAIRRTLALSVMDAEVGQLVDHFERQRRKKLEVLARRFKKDCRLPGTVRDIACTLSLYTSFATFDQLLLDSSEANATKQLVALAKKLVSCA